jgi:hypothetical protein
LAKASVLGSKQNWLRFQQMHPNFHEISFYSLSAALEKISFLHFIYWEQFRVQKGQGICKEAMK